MLRQTVSKHAFVRALAPVSLPAVAVLAVLAVAGRLDPFAAVLGALACVLAMAWPVRRHLADILDLGAYAEALRNDGAAARPRLRHPRAAPELEASIARLGQSLDRRRRGFERLATSADSILDSLPEPLIMLDARRRVVRATARARELVGTEDIAGRDLSVLVRNPEVLEVADRITAQGGSEEVEFSLFAPVARTFGARIARLADAAEDGTVAVLALYDMTAVRRAERTRVDFVASASHELRTPLSVLVGGIKTLRGSGRDDPAAQERFLGIMEAQAERMSRLVQDLLSLSRIEINEHTAPSGAVGLPGLIGQVVDSLEFPASERGARIEIDAAPNLPDVAGERVELAQLFQNLIDNAIKYGREDSPVRIRMRRKAGVGRNAAGDEAPAVAVSISDRGDGIAAEHLPRLTERFYRVDTARSRELGGTGLGLAIVKHIVNRHRGALEIESELGAGSVFTVSLPCAPPDETDASAPRLS